MMVNLDKGPPIGLTPGFGNNNERRAAAELALAEREQWRQRQLAQQASPLNDAADRIKIWEAFHGLELPRARNHKLLWVIAEQTQLPLADVVSEQLRRAEIKAQ